MNFEIRDLYFDHIITYCDNLSRKDWLTGILLLENMSLVKDIYQNGPIIFSLDSKDKDNETVEFTYYMPINEAVVFDDESYYAYLPKLHIQNALTLRQDYREANFQKAYKRLTNYAKHQEISLGEKLYCVLLESYGEYIIDLYVPIK